MRTAGYQGRVRDGRWKEEKRKAGRMEEEKRMREEGRREGERKKEKKRERKKKPLKINEGIFEMR